MLYRIITMFDVYRTNILKYPLTDNEYKLIDEVWEFLEIFAKEYIYVTNYRKSTINIIREKYTLEQFYIYECILNKIFWNLRWMLFPLWIYNNFTKKEYMNYVANNYGQSDEIPSCSLLLYDMVKYKNEQDMNNKIKDVYDKHMNFYRSFINKIIMVDKQKKCILIKPMEGSSNIFSKNYFNLLTFTIFFDRDLYEKTMNDPYNTKYSEIILSEYYYQYDYPFPNLNCCVYSFGTKKDKMKRIELLYFNKNEPYDNNWFKIIK